MDLISIVKAAGYLGLFAILFAETGLLIGFFLPGDSLLFTAGILASQHYLNIEVLIPLIIIAVFCGDNLGYWIGRKIGPKIFKKEDSFWFRKSHLEKTQEFFQRHGSKTLVIARFVPIVRTFASTMAGVGAMSYKKFLFFAGIGAVLWGTTLTLLGYYLGVSVPHIDKYIIPGIVLIILVSISPYLYKFATNKELRQRIYTGLRHNGQKR
jgi:membrane-associated protein